MGTAHVAVITAGLRVYFQRRVVVVMKRAHGSVKAALFLKVQPETVCHTDDVGAVLDGVYGFLGDHAFKTELRIMN